MKVHVVINWTKPKDVAVVGVFSSRDKAETYEIGYCKEHNLAANVTSVVSKRVV